MFHLLAMILHSCILQRKKPLLQRKVSKGGRRERSGVLFLLLASHIECVTSQTCRAFAHFKLLEFRKESGSQLAEYHFCLKPLCDRVNDIAACLLGMFQKDRMAQHAAIDVQCSPQVILGTSQLYFNCLELLASIEYPI